MALFSNIGSGDLAMMQAQLDEQRATEVANLTPNQIYQQMAYKAGSGLTRGIGGLLGADMVDPELKRRSERARIVGEINPEDEASLAQGIKNLQQAGFAEDAFALSARLLERQKKKAEIASEQALVTQRTRERPQNASLEEKTFVELAKKATPKSVAAAMKAGNDISLLEVPEAVKVSTYGQILKDAGFKEGTPEFQSKMKTFAEAELESTKKGKATTINMPKPVDVANIIKEIGTKEDIKDKAATWKAAGDAYKMQVPMIAKLQEVKEALPKTFTGSFSDTALQFGKGLSALGIPVDRSKLANTEYMNSVSSQVLQTIARNFPGSLAVKEMDQLVKSKFNSQQQIETVSRILGDLQTEIEAGTKSYEQLAKLPETERYSKDLNLLTGQNFNKLKRYRALEQKAKSLTTGQKMSKQEIEEAKKLQSELGV